MGSTRRNPKRKAAEESNESFSPNQAELLEEALRPLKPGTAAQWRGWVELESDPALFNFILRDLGVPNVKTHDVADFETLQSTKQQPIYGLIFCFKYQPVEHDPDEEEEDAPSIWFANQTTDNACASIAMLNIVMNIPNIRLGEELRQFKRETLHLSTALRGRHLAQNEFIRRNHNTFAKRMNYLEADLVLENQASKPRPKKKKTSGSRRKTAKKRTANPAVSNAFHFVAYVPAQGSVWELDGLETKPYRLDCTKDDDWISVARSHILSRMQESEEVSLIQLCSNPLSVLIRELAAHLKSLRFIYHMFATPLSGNPGWDLRFLNIETEEVLAEFMLSKEDVANTEVPQDIQDEVHQEGFDLGDALDLNMRVIVKARDVMEAYRSEVAIEEDDEEEMVDKRKKDYTPAIHKWVTKLAEREMLNRLIIQSQGQ